MTKTTLLSVREVDEFNIARNTPKLKAECIILLIKCGDKIISRVLANKIGAGQKWTGSVTLMDTIVTKNYNLDPLVIGDALVIKGGGNDTIFKESILKI